MNFLITAAVPVFFVVVFYISHFINKKATAERNTANSLVVLSGLLTALAILVPIGATFLPDGHSVWQTSLLVGALLTGVLCLFFTVFSMIKLQDKEKFKPSEQRYVPGSVNSTWITLAFLSAALVAVKSLPTVRENTESGRLNSQIRFAVAHDLPQLGASRQAIETKWGTPAHASDSEIQYRTSEGVVVFCLDAQGLARSIIETREGDPNAVRSYCK